MAGFQPTYEGIQEMILRDQYFLTCDKSMQIFLKEKGKLSLKEMTKVSNDYLEAHGYPAMRISLLASCDNVFSISVIVTARDPRHEPAG